MNVSYALRLLGAVIAWAGLLASLYLLNEEPLFGVLGILGALALLLNCLAKLFVEGSKTTISLED